MTTVPGTKLWLPSYNKLPPTTHRHGREWILDTLGQVGRGTAAPQFGCRFLDGVVECGFRDSLGHTVIYHTLVRHFVFVPESLQLGAGLGTLDCIGIGRLLGGYYNRS